MDYVVSIYIYMTSLYIFISSIFICIEYYPTRHPEEGSTIKVLCTVYIIYNIVTSSSIPDLYLLQLC